MSGKRIENDEAYDRSNKWLVERALKMSDPLIDPDVKAELMKQYDFVAEQMQRYRRSRLVKEYPGLREAYATLGLNYDEPEEQPTTPQAPKDEPQPTIKEETPQAEVPYRDFLDDDD